MLRKTVCVIDDDTKFWNTTDLFFRMERMNKYIDAIPIGSIVIVVRRDAVSSTNNILEFSEARR